MNKSKSKYSNHQNYLKQVMLEIQNELPQLRLFQQHVGMFYTRFNKPIKVGIKGEADIYGLYNNGSILCYVQIEIKTGNATQSKDQKKWQRFINSMNGIYFVFTNKKDLKGQLNEFKNRIYDKYGKQGSISNSSKSTLER